VLASNYLLMTLIRVSITWGVTAPIYRWDMAVVPCRMELYKVMYGREGVDACREVGAPHIAGGGGRISGRSRIRGGCSSVSLCQSDTTSTVSYLRGVP
jgi:hypothetical protein